MSISTIRKYTADDKNRVRASAERFCARHGIDYDNSEDYADAEVSIDYAIDSRYDGAYLRKLWTAVYCRALRVSTDVRTTTGWGYIGIQID